MARTVTTAHPARELPRGRLLLGLGLTAVVVAVVIIVILATTWSNATLSSDASALAVVKLQPLAGTLERAQAFAPDGGRIALAVAGRRITPLARITPGERVAVEVVIRRPGWLGWALGSTKTERLTLRAPTARVTQPWVTVASGSSVRVSFDQPVTSIAYGAAGHLVAHPLAGAQTTVELGQQAPAGSIEVAAAVRSWERRGAPAIVSWFPQSSAPVMVTTPAPGSSIPPTGKIRLTFSVPVTHALGTATPQLTPDVPGAWRSPDSHTLEFTPAGTGIPLGSKLALTLPSAVATMGPSGGLVQTSREIHWTVLPGSTRRLQELLAQAGYLPVNWSPTGAPVAATEVAEVEAAVDPPAGAFSWRYPNTPPELKALWTPGQANQVTRGAVMMFENEHHLTVDAIAGASVWKALIAEAIAGKATHADYSYVYVHRNTPQLLTLWSDGNTVLTSPGNTGVPAAPTQLGTFQVFEHLPVGTMSGTNPDGSQYNDPGIQWISYFNGGDALHSFNRASFGTPQSLGCVELPLAAAAKIWPYTPIGTLVTIEN